MPESPENSLQVTKSAAGYIVQIIGRGTMHASPALAQFSIGCLTTSADSLVIDLSVCEYLDSTFLGCLVTLQRRFGNSTPPRFAIAADNAVCEKLLGPTRLIPFFHIIESAPPSVDASVSLPCSLPERNAFGRHLQHCHQELADLGGPESEAFARIAKKLAEELDDS